MLIAQSLVMLNNYDSKEYMMIIKNEYVYDDNDDGDDIGAVAHEDRCI